MHIEMLRDYCLAKNGVVETFPFGEETLVFKVAAKMFCLIGLDAASKCNLKCEPEKAIELRQRYSAVIPGFHMNKQHWNTIHFNQDLGDELILQLIDHSYQLIVDKLPKKIRNELAIL
ncbi:MAG: MmcQ/YjbR family DNA-binding protein [bacterium]|nr:MmcQ/YjbR family DNA-binding protein [bacterium]